MTDIVERIRNLPHVGIPRPMIMDAAADEITKLRQQRDELVAAVREVIDDAEECSDADDWTAILISLETFHNLDTAYNAALAKIEGEKNGLKGEDK